MSYTNEELRVLVRAIPTGEWKTLVPAILQGSYTLPGGNPETRPADALAGLLRDSTTPPEVRSAIIEACRSQYAPLSEILRTRPMEISAGARRFAENYSSLIQQGFPPELADDTRGLLALAVSKHVPGDFRTFFVAAAVALASESGQPEFWVGYVEENLFPTQAFTALVRTDPNHTSVQTALISIWRRVLGGEVRALMPLFVRDALIARGDMVQSGELTSRGAFFLRTVLHRVIDDSSDRFVAVKAQLERFTWSKEWVNLIGAPRVDNKTEKALAELVSNTRKIIRTPEIGRIEMSEIWKGVSLLLHPENVNIVTKYIDSQSFISLTVDFSGDDKEVDQIVNREFQVLKSYLCRLQRQPGDVQPFSLQWTKVLSFS